MYNMRAEDHELLNGNNLEEDFVLLSSTVKTEAINTDLNRYAPGIIET
jgi:hypothetical protein